MLSRDEHVPSRRAVWYHLNFLSIAGGSLSEVETYLHLAVDLEFVDAERVRNALGYADEIGRMATALRRDRL